LIAANWAKNGADDGADLIMTGNMIFKNLRDEIDSMIARDPAARSRLEIVLAYPGFQAVMFYRLANAAWRRGWLLLGRVISGIGRFVTGIEIHPGATIGKRLFIDHGMGLVIGETAEIGDDVTLYHGVTLGGIAPSVNSAAQVNRKRHPTLRNGVIVGSGAQVLGPITVGENARVGANAVVVQDVPPGVTVVGIPAKVVAPREARAKFHAYGIPDGDLPDPVARAVDGLLDQVSALRARVEDLEHRLEEHGPQPPVVVDLHGKDAVPDGEPETNGCRDPETGRRIDC
jgi:serine O-acetyltransferase